MNQIIHGDSLEVLKTLKSESVDLVCTDPPYGYSFMGKAWDKTLPDKGIFEECLRVLKPGAFAFVMSAPRSDVCARMMLLLEDAGFEIGFTPIYWTYASGFPKAMNIGKMVDKRNGTSPDESREFAAYIKARRLELGITLSRADQEVCGGTTNYSWFEGRPNGQRLPRLEEYERMKILLQLDGRYDGFIGEAEREVVGKKSSGIGTAFGDGEWKSGKVEEVDVTAPATDAAKALDGSYGGFQPKPAVEVIIVAMKPLSEKTYVDQALRNGKGVTWLDDCRIPICAESEEYDLASKVRPNQTGIDTWGRTVSSGWQPQTGRFPANLLVSDDVLDDHSRFFSLDAWAKTLPFLAVPKAAKSEKNAGLAEARLKATHPTTKPVKLMAYLIQLASRPGDTVLDPFAGSGTCAVACKNLKRNYIMVEKESEYVDIMRARVDAVQEPMI